LQDSCLRILKIKMQTRSNILNLIKLFKEYKGYIHKDLYVKYSENRGYGFFAKKKLNKEETLIKVPFSLTINAKDFLDFLDAKKINYPLSKYI